LSGYFRFASLNFCVHALKHSAGTGVSQVQHNRQILRPQKGETFHGCAAR
jgi:hypothetical protein